MKYQTLGMLCLLAANSASAKTLYVDGQTQNSGAECTKAAPCLTMQEAITLAERNDRIVVGPGYYSEGTLMLDEDGIKLESVAGSKATFLVSDGPELINATGNKIVIGKKGKGFSLWREDESAENGTVMIRGTGDKIKIEGNSFWPFDYTYGSNQSGPIIELTGTDAATIRHNYLGAGKAGINIVSDGRANHIIDSNRLEDMQGSCIDLTLDAGGNAKIRKNFMTACREVQSDSRAGNSAGIRVATSMGGGKATIQDNSVTRTPIGFYVVGAPHLVQRNVHTFGREHVIVEAADKVQIKDNLGQFISYGYTLDADVTNATISGNRLNSNQPLVHIRELESSLKSFTNNQLVRRTSSSFGPGPLCPVSLGGDNYPDGIVLKKNSWGGFAEGMGNDSPNLDTYADCDATNAEIAYNNFSITFDGVSKNASVKVKDKSPF